MSEFDFKVKNGLVVANTVLIANAESNRVSINSNTQGVTLDIGGTDGVRIPMGNTSQRISSNGVLRFNTETLIPELYYNGWFTFIVGANGSNTQIQYNSNGAFSSSSKFTYDVEQNKLTLKANTGNGLFLASDGTSAYLQNQDSGDIALIAQSSFVATLAGSEKARISNTGTLTLQSNSTVNTALSSAGLTFANSSTTFTYRSPANTQIGNTSLFWNANGTYSVVIAVPAGSNTQVQYNDSGAYAGTGNFTFNKDTNTLSVANTVAATILSGNLVATTVNIGSSRTTANTISFVSGQFVANTSDTYITSGHFRLNSTGSVIVNSTSGNKVLIQNGSGSNIGAYYSDGTNQGFVNAGGSWIHYTDQSGNFTAAGNVAAYSDERLKEDIEKIENALDLIKNVNGVRYTRKSTGVKEIGLIAQNLLQYIPEAVNSKTEFMSVSYGNLVGVLIEAIKELEARVKELESK